MLKFLLLGFMTNGLGVFELSLITLLENYSKPDLEVVLQMTL